MNIGVAVLLFSLPLATFVGSVLLISGPRIGHPSWVGDWRRGFVLGAIAWGTFTIAVSEVLSLFHAINRVWLGLSWGMALVLVVIVGTRLGVWAPAWDSLRRARLEFEWKEALLPGGAAAIGAILLGIALISPSNNNDSLIYHMTRVVHWAENASLADYPAAVHHQLLKPIWAETAILNMRVLWGSDRIVNLIQWFSMAGSLVIVSAIAKQLGAGRRGQLLSAVAALTIPMGILQASTTQNDYVAAFWTVALAYLVLLNHQRGLGRWENLGLGSCLGLGILTKGTFFVYAPPLMLWWVWSTFRRRGILKLLQYGVFIGCLVVAINLGFWVRNTLAFGGPYGPSTYLKDNLGINVTFLGKLGQLLGESTPTPQSTATPVPQSDLAPTGSAVQTVVNAVGPIAHSRPTTASRGLTQQSSGPVGWLGNLLKREAQVVGWNLVAPIGPINRAMKAILRAFPSIYDQAFFAQMPIQAWNNEDSAGNPFHLLLVPVCLVLAVVFRRKLVMKDLLPYAVVALACYELLPVVIHHGPTIWGTRYQLPFFVMWTPVIGVTLETWLRPRLLSAFGLLLLVYALPWVLLNNMRPLIGMPPWPTKIESILVAPQPEILLATNTGLVDDYVGVVNAVKATECKQVGLRIETQTLEYPLWWLFSAPQSGYTLRVINSAAFLERYGDPNFKPCAVICSNCGGRPEFMGMQFAGHFDSFELYTNER